MSLTITVDAAGRLVLPKTVRDEMHLEAGDKLELQMDGDRISLSPVRAASRMSRKQGVWVFGGGTVSPPRRAVSQSLTDGVLQSIRGSRDMDNRGTLASKEER